MQNLYNETIDILKENGKTESDVIWFGHLFSDYEAVEYPREKFKEFLNFKYDKGYGLSEVDEHLCVVGHDWWLERHEYDGLEWWEYKTLPNRPKIVTNGFYLGGL